MLKKITVLAMAVGVLAALALPTSASAFWKHGHAGAEIAQDVTVNFTGQLSFQGPSGGIKCQLTSSLLFKKANPEQGQNGTTGTVEQFKTHPKTVPNPDTENCQGTGGLSPCQIHDVTPQTNLFWVFHTVTVGGEGKIQVTQPVNLTSQLTGGFFCLVKKVVLTPPNEAGGQFVTLTPNQPNTITSGTLSGQLQADIQTNSGAIDKENVALGGSMTIEPFDKNWPTSIKHTYSI